MTRLEQIREMLDMNTKRRPVDRRLFRNLMSDSDLEVLGMVYSLLMKDSRRIKPPLEFEEILSFLLHYYGRCLAEDPENAVWADSRYSASHDLANWFSSMFHDTSRSRYDLERVKSWLGSMYKAGNLDLRTCIETGTLEHLFEQKKIRRFFEDWREDQILTVAYQNASEWIQGGGNTPLAKKRWFDRAKE